MRTFLRAAYRAPAQRYVRYARKPGLMAPWVPVAVLLALLIARGVAC